MSTFESFNFAEAVAENLKRHGFETPTPIQAEAIPLVMKGHDVIGLAQTGTGKTAAFVLPMLHRLSSGPGRYVRALIVSPTRELAEQINGVVHQLGRGTHLHTASIYGGVSYRPQFDAIRRGAEIVVACPGRLLDHVEQGSIRLDRVEMLVLDEADQMFDMGFLPAIKNIVRRLPANRQTLLFSATMPPEIRKLAHEILRDPKEVKLSYTAPVNTVSHAIYPCRQENKTEVVVELLRRTDAGPVLIFTRTRHRTKRLAEQLERSGFTAASIEGGLTQNRRKRAMDGFRNGQFQILVATDVAARGIDVSGISHVINYDMPDTIEAYTHRIGRTGRAAKTGDAFTLVTREDNDMVRQIERALNAPIERRFLEGFAPPERERQSGGGRPPQRGGGGGGGGRNDRGPARGNFRDRPPRRDDNFKPFSGHKPAAVSPAQAAPAPAIAPEATTHSAPSPAPSRREFTPRNDQHPPRRFEDRPPRKFEGRRDDRSPRQFDDRAPRRFDDRAPGPRSDGPRSDAPSAKKFGGPGFAKKPYGAGPGKPYAPKAHGEYRSARKDRATSSDAAPTMTGAAPYVPKERSKNVPFWQKKFGKRS